MLISEILHKTVESASLAAFKDKNFQKENLPNFIIEKPKNTAFGDYATSLPLQLAKTLDQNPIKIAEAINNAIPKLKEIELCSVEPPGFLNFKLSQEWTEKQLLKVLKDKEKYGSKAEVSSKNIQVEFVSVNPTGRLHLGHMRGAIIGSTLSNVLESQNYNVIREYYVNDAGNQMNNFGKSLLERMKEIKGDKFSLGEDHYKGEDIKEVALTIAKEFKDEDLDDISKDLFAQITKRGMEICIEMIKSDLADLNIHHDNWFYESSLIKSNYLDKTLTKLKDSNLTYEKDGALWIKTQELGDERDNVLIKSIDKKPTYFATDIAYHRNKFEERKFDEGIDVWGADHHGHVKRMKLVLEKLGIESSKLTVLLNQIVSLKDISGVARFSKREGTSIFIKDLINEIGSDACRFSFLNRSPESQMEIDINIFRKKSSENPVFYIQYAHARMSSILRSSIYFDISITDADPNLLSTPGEIILIKKLLEYPELLNRVSYTLQVQELPAYALELSQLIHKFYENNRVIDEDIKNIEMTKSRLLLVKASKITLSNLLNLMEMESPEKM